MIGPRSALFTPFDRLGLIIIDEEHESAYQSEIVPRYQAAEVAAGELDVRCPGCSWIGDPFCGGLSERPGRE